jgi:SAM-dependent methyltransferase
MNDAQKLQKYFFKDLGWGRGYQAKVVFNFLLQAAEFCENDVILDAGAGHQRYKPFFKSCFYITQEHEAGIKFKNMGSVSYDLISPIDEKIPLKDNALKAVLSTSVIEHLSQPQQFIYEALRVLKPGGKIFINVPFCYPEHETPYDFNRPTRYALKQWLSRAGFQDIEVCPTSSATETITSFLPLAVWNDIRRTDKPFNIVYEELKKSPVGYLRKLEAMFRLVLAKISMKLFQLFGIILKWAIDRGPYEGTFLPVGWIAIARKPGEYVKSGVKNKDEFLKQFRQ